MNIVDYLILIIAGTGAGFLNVVAGGGSLITLPLMIFMGLPPAVANGTNRVALLAQNIVAVSNFNKKGVASNSYSLLIGTAALIGAIIGAKIAVTLNDAIFNKILSVVMVAVAALIAFNPKVADSGTERLDLKHRIIGTILFFFIGIYGGFLHAGIGFIIMLSLIKVNRFNLVKTNSVKVAVALIYTVSALVVFILQDMIDWKVGVILAVGNATGGWLGSNFSVKKGDVWIKRIVIIAISVMAVKLWFF